MKIRATISIKILGLATILLGGMTSIALYSSRKVMAINAELATVAHYYMRMDVLASNIESETLQLQVDFERALRSHGNGTFQQAQKARGDQVRDRIAHNFSRLNKLLSQIKERAHHADSLDELSLTAESVAREHDEFEAQRVATISRLAANQPLSSEQRAKLTKEQRDFTQRLSNLRQSLDALVTQAILRSYRHERDLIRGNITITVIACALALLIALLITSILVSPLRALVEGTRALEAGDLEIEIPVTTDDEVGDLTRAFNEMTHGLRTKDRIHRTFGKYLDPRVVEELLAFDPQITPPTRRQRMTVLFSDIIGFTRISEQLTPVELVDLINAYLTAMSGPVTTASGVIDKYIGDSIMAFWGEPFIPDQEQARLACDCALDQRAALLAFRQGLPQLTSNPQLAQTFDFRTGIATGEVIVGSIGSETSRSYTVMGDVVNLGARLEALNRVYQTSILISEPTWAAAESHIEARELDCVRVKGKDRPARIFELLARAGELAPGLQDTRAHYQDGLEAYRRLDLSRARQQFRHALEHTPDDRPSQLMLTRCDDFEKTPPPGDWDGTWSFSSK